MSPIGRPAAGRRLATSGPLWLALGVAFAAVTVLGTVGFTRYQQAAESAVDPLATRVYLAVQLFVLESGSVRGEVPWQLELSRFVAPLVAAYAIVQMLAAVFRGQVEALRLQLVRRHVVVAGLGHKGSRPAPCAPMDRSDRRGAAPEGRGTDETGHPAGSSARA